jgi:hypothetical protein
MTGVDAERRKLRFWPGDPSKIKEFKAKAQNAEEDVWLLRITCGIHSVPPQSLGFTMDVNKTTAESQDDNQERAMLAPLMLWMERILTDVIQNDLGQPELCFKYAPRWKQEDRFKQAQADKVYIAANVYDEDYVRDRDGIVLGKDSPALQRAEMQQKMREQMLANPGQPPQAQQASNPNSPPPTRPGESPGSVSNMPAPGQPKPGQPKPGQPKTDKEKAAESDLRKWREKALGRVKLGKRAACEFESAAIDEGLRKQVEDGLEKALSADDVRTLFDDALDDAKSTNRSDKE